MAKITKISPQEKRKGRANIYVDGQFLIGVAERILLDEDLYVGKEVDESEVERIKEAEGLSKLLESAFRLLAVRPRSEAELRERLLRKYEIEGVEKTIAKLFEYGYLNDSDFAERWVAERQKKKGKRALYFEMLKKGIKKETIELALEPVTGEVEVESARELLVRKRAYHSLPEPEKSQKQTRFLAARGFSYEVIKKVLAK